MLAEQRQGSHARLQGAQIYRRDTGYHWEKIQGGKQKKQNICDISAQQVKKQLCDFPVHVSRKIIGVQPINPKSSENPRFSE